MYSLTVYKVNEYGGCDSALFHMTNCDLKDGYNAAINELNLKPIKGKRWIDSLDSFSAQLSEECLNNNNEIHLYDFVFKLVQNPINVLNEIQCNFGEK